MPAVSDGARPAGSAPTELTRIVLRPIGSPLPLGLLALFCAGILLSLLSVGALEPDQGRPIAFILLGFVVPLMLVASVLAFLARDTVAGTALGLFAGAWLASALVMLTSPPGQTSPAFGAFLLALGGGMVVLISGAAFGKAGPAAVLVFGAARFALAGLYEVTGSVGLAHVAGVVGFALAGAALYSSLATEIEDVRGAPKLPLGRRGQARAALEGSFEEQLHLLEHEAGVRQQL
jgi:uncharacterized protein